MLVPARSIVWRRGTATIPHIELSNLIGDREWHNGSRCNIRYHMNYCTLPGKEPDSSS
jgi:hypothetical protein